MSKTVPILVLAALLVAACGEATLPCGDFTFNGAPHSNRGIDMDVSFDFDPADCGAAACTCDEIAYVQIVRIIDLNTGNYLSPNTDQTNRIVTGRSDPPLNGWAVDRLMNREWGYYGRFDDGSFASTLTPGDNSTAAVLRDKPSGWPDASWFDAVSVPVCIDTSASCSNELAGYYYWLFTVGSGGSVSNPFDKDGVDWNQDAFDEAVIEWNNDAPGLGKNSFPTFSRMP